jgi:hypothetical protein
MSRLKSLTYLILPFMALLTSGCSQTLGLGPLKALGLGGSQEKLSPPSSLAQPEMACPWQEIRGAGLSIQGYQCPQSEIVGDESLPGLVVRYEYEGKQVSAPLIQIFEIKEGASIDSINQAVRAASPAQDNHLCALHPSPSNDGTYEFLPTGDLKQAYEQPTALEDGLAEPCGPMGPSEAGGRYFFRLKGSNTKIIVAFMPSDLPSFDIKSLKAAD